MPHGLGPALGSNGPYYGTVLVVVVFVAAGSYHRGSLPRPQFPLTSDRLFNPSLVLLTPTALFCGIGNHPPIAEGIGVSLLFVAIAILVGCVIASLGILSKLTRSMEAATDTSVPDAATAAGVDGDGGRERADETEVEGFRHQVDEILSKVDQLELRVKEVEQFYVDAAKKQAHPSRGNSACKEKDKEKHAPSVKKQQQDALRREATAAKRMQELMRQFGTILRQITKHNWAWPFMQPVDVEGLGLHDYHQVIDKPMDLGTVKDLMEATDGSGYKNVREIYADVRLVFNNAMKYNSVKNDVHVMARTLLEKFEEKWLQFLPKVTEEEKRREEEAAEAQVDMQLAQEDAYAKMARDISNELYELDVHLEELREMVVQKCRKISTEEKRNIGTGLGLLSPEDLNKALEIVALGNPNFSSTAEEIDLDMDAQSESTLWRLKFFVKEALEVQGKASLSAADNMATHNSNNNQNNKRKREICNAIAKSAKKRNKKLP